MQTVVVQRTGNARTRRASIDGVQLSWQSENPDLSQPKQLPAGDHLFTWYVEGDEDQTYGYFFLEPPGIPCVVDPDPLPSDGSRDWGECGFELA